MATILHYTALITLSVLCSVSAQQFQFSRLWHPGKRAFDYSSPYYTSWSPFSGLAGVRVLNVRQPEVSVKTSDDYVLEDNGSFYSEPSVATFSGDPVGQTITQPVNSPVKRFFFTRPWVLTAQPASLLTSGSSIQTGMSQSSAGKSKDAKLL